MELLLKCSQKNKREKLLICPTLTEHEKTLEIFNKSQLRDGKSKFVDHFLTVQEEFCYSYHPLEKEHISLET